MKKMELLNELKERNVKAYKSWTISKLQETLENNKDKFRVIIKSEIIEPSGNWNVAKDWFPTIEVNQETRTIEITTYETEGFQNRASVETDYIETFLSKKGNQLLLTGTVYVKNWVHGKCSGSQNFVFAIFIGDSGHIYTHRAPATRGWLNLNPENIKKRLVKLGIGCTNRVIQQGDFLLKPAKTNAYPDSEFKHETKGAGHHNFEMPVLYATGGKGRQYKITENTLLIHTAVDGIQHPTIPVSPGIYIVGTTANQLNHSNARD